MAGWVAVAAHFREWQNEGTGEDGQLILLGLPSLGLGDMAAVTGRPLSISAGQHSRTHTAPADANAGTPMQGTPCHTADGDGRRATHAGKERQDGEQLGVAERTRGHAT